MSAELPRPGVEVTQVFRAVSPTVITPTLVPCVVGVCKQVVEVLTTTSSGSNELNSDSLMSLPGFFLAKAASGDPPLYTGLDGLDLVLSINNGPSVTITFEDADAAGLSPTTVVSQILDAFSESDVTAATAETVGDDQFRVRTLGLGEFESIEVMDGTDATVLTTLAIAVSKQYVGLSTYDQHKVDLPKTNFPDPRSNLTQLAIDDDTTRVFLALGSGTSLREVLRTESFLRSGEDSAAVDDGNGDGVTPIIRFAGEDFTAAGTVATVTGDTDVDTAGLYGVGGDLDGLTLTLGDGRVSQTITFDVATNAASQASMLTALNDLFGAAGGGGLVFTVPATAFTIKSVDKGVEGIVDVVGGTALTLLGIDVGVTRGDPFPPAAGDELYVDGALLGKITKVAPGGTVTDLKIDKQVTIDATLGADFYIIAKNLSGAQTSTRPSADLVMDLNGQPTVKHELLRDTTGNPVASSRASMYLQYTAVRKDVTSKATNPGLLRFDDTTSLESALSPISTSNPLALGIYFALLNAPGIQVTGLGVDAITADAPFGTVEAFTSAAEFLEAFEVYGIAPLTHDATVGQVFNTHVNVMSEAGNKGERIVVFNPDVPTEKLDTLVASGTTGNSVSPHTTQFDTGIANLSALLLNAGVSPVGTIAATSGVYLDIASDSKKYSISGISGPVVTIRTTFTGGANDDDYYAETELNDAPLGASLIDEAFAVRIRGASLINTDGTPDKQGMADTLASLGQTFLNRRYWQIVPDSCAATIDGLEQVIDGFYLCAAIVGMIGQQPPQQSFTNFPMAGFTRVIGSNDFFSERQLNQIAAGGSWIVVQDSQGAPLISRMALTTDMTSVETRTDSITKVVDFTAKFLRRGLKNFIGRFNITQGFLDSLGHVIQGLLGYLTEAGVLIGANLNNIIQDEDAPDTVLVDISLDVPYPCNFIRLTLVV